MCQRGFNAVNDSTFGNHLPGLSQVFNLLRGTLLPVFSCLPQHLVVSYLGWFPEQCIYVICDIAYVL